jgi:hypothetical protein
MKAYDEKVARLSDAMNELERFVILKAVNDRWMDHLQMVEYVRDGISLRGACIYVWKFMPCANCCTLLIQSGIRRVVAPDHPIPDRWHTSFSLSQEMLREAEVDFVVLDCPTD